MRVGVISVYTDYHRRGAHHRGVLQPHVGALIAALLPAAAQVEVVNDAWTDPDWRRDYDLLFISCLHSDFDRARQISHYWRRRGAATVLGGNFASLYPRLCKPFFDAVVIGDPESTVRRVYDDFGRGALEPYYLARAYDPALVPTPRFDLTARELVLPLNMEITRGCPYTCEFCALTAVGTRHHVRPAAAVVRDIARGRAMTRRFASIHRHKLAIFYDNNLGGNLPYLRALCRELEPLGLYWGVCVTFNVICDPELLARMARAGCRGLFVGLESFNDRTLQDMRKFQNVLGKLKAAIAQCHRHGILVMAGLMLSPGTDDAAYMASIPDRLRECGLHVPTYICFETPFPGTPHFDRLARMAETPFLPNALLRDFNGYTLVTRPAHMSAAAFVDAYKALHARVYSRWARAAKFVHDLAATLPARSLMPAALDLYELLSEGESLAGDRTFIAGTDSEPPERVPLTDADFATDHERDAILRPYPVTDATGQVLATWLHARPVYGRRGQVIAGHPEGMQSDAPVTLRRLSVR